MFIQDVVQHSIQIRQMPQVKVVRLVALPVLEEGSAVVTIGKTLQEPTEFLVSWLNHHVLLLLTKSVATGFPTTNDRDTLGTRDKCSLSVV
jgi:hypothetical protein